MKKKHKLSETQISVLLWLKVLDDFHGDGFENSTFNEKFNAFEAVEDTGISREEYDASVDFWIKKGIIKKSLLTKELSISRRGKRFFKKLENEDSSLIAYFFNTNSIQKLFDEIKKWVAEKYEELEPEVEKVFRRFNESEIVKAISSILGIMASVLTIVSILVD